MVVLATVVLWYPRGSESQSAAENNPLRVQILNGRTGRPVANEHLRIVRTGGHALDGSHDIPSLTSDGEGYVPVPNVDSSVPLITIAVDWHRPCSKTGKNQFSLVQVRSVGVVSENSCRSRITLYPQPGTLIFFVRDETFLEKMRH